MLRSLNSGQILFMDVDFQGLECFTKKGPRMESLLKCILLEYNSFKGGEVPRL